MNSPEGKRVPEMVFKARKDGEWNDIDTKEFFGGKKVVVFSLPGAFTPTCSSTHLPRYEELASVFAGHGIDAIACVSVNDGFVMDAWAKDQHVENVVLLPDGNGEFTDAMGLLVDKSVIGFGKRSWRYSMLVEDGVVTKAFVEPEKPGDPFEVSDADTMLGHVAPNAALPKEVTIFTKPGCPFCAKAKAKLRENNLPYEEIVLGSGISYASVRNVTGKSTVPQVFIDGKHIGGSDDLEAYFG